MNVSSDVTHLFNRPIQNNNNDESELFQISRFISSPIKNPAYYINVSQIFHVHIKSTYTNSKTSKIQTNSSKIQALTNQYLRELKLRKKYRDKK